MSKGKKPIKKGEPSKKVVKDYGQPVTHTEQHKSTVRGSYYQAKGGSHDIKAIARKKGKSVAAVKGKAGAPGRKSYKDVAGFLNIQK